MAPVPVIFASLSGREAYLTGEVGRLYTPDGLLLYFHSGILLLMAFSAAIKPHDL